MGAGECWRREGPPSVDSPRKRRENERGSCRKMRGEGRVVTVEGGTVDRFLQEGKLSRRGGKVMV